MNVLGKLKVDIYKHDILIDSREGSNLVVNTGKQLICYLLAGEPGNHVITKFGVGESGSHPDVSDSGLLNSHINIVNGYTILEPTVVQWDFVLGAAEAIGMTIAEFGLYSQDEQLFARKIRLNGDPILKDKSISMHGYWTIYLLECKKTTFSTYASINTNITDPVLQYYLEITGQADITTDISTPELDQFQEMRFAVAPAIQTVTSSTAGFLYQFGLGGDTDNDGSLDTANNIYGTDGNTRQMGSGNFTGQHLWTWMRFPNVDIDPGTNLTSAKIKFWHLQATQNNWVNLRFMFEYHDNSVTPSSRVEMMARTYTDSLGAVGYVDWNQIPQHTDNSYWYSPELKDVLQYIIDRPGWQAGNSILFLAKDNGSSFQSNRDFIDQNYWWHANYNPSYLEVSY